MDKLAKFVENYDCSQVDSLPKPMKRRLDALKKLQLEHVDLSLQYHKEIQQIELKYEKLYQPIYEKRSKIISGEYEPTDQECQLPPVLEDKPENDQENDSKNQSKGEELNVPDSEIKGIPSFWLGCLASSSNFTDSIEPHDRQVLKYLKDIKLVYGGEGSENMTYTLEFVFDENPYFSNPVLTKTYFLKLKPDEKDPFSFDGYEVIKAEGCKINWLPGKDVTTKTITVKQKNKNDGRSREKKKEIQQDSFFYFFKPPPGDLNDPASIDDDIAAIMGIDFELGEILRQSMIPKAALFYSGHQLDDDDESDEEDYDTDEEDEDEDDEDVDGADNIDSEDSLDDETKKIK